MRTRSRKLIEKEETPPKVSVKHSPKKTGSSKVLIPEKQPSVAKLIKHDFSLGWFKPADIKYFLDDLAAKSNGRLDVEVIGQSNEGRDICMAIIRQNPAKPSSFGVFIECGSNGCDWLAIGAGLYLIDRLVKDQETVPQNADYYVIPCSNPDAYENSFSPHSPLVDLSHNYPIQLGHRDVRKIPENSFQAALLRWRRSYRFMRNECVAVMNGLLANMRNIKMFVSIQEGASKPKILYPYGFCVEKVEDEGVVKEVAMAANRSSKDKLFGVSSVYEAAGVDFGNIVDFLQLSGRIKFNYVMHINDRRRKPKKQLINSLGAEVLTALKNMSEEAIKHLKDGKQAISYV
ncbi:unnamed protein product [Callosobruchus maculatus]|uniref:Peptidase M14 domain-containing protein n=1 Tax=Callosobruchus maculatus TaxID=64391 RepID=A0A653DB20_CALMS|nr:unnamed protein product [Callosobruchus maculatus]